jgi:ATP-dependent protease ClpP protease subunit
VAAALISSSLAHASDPCAQGDLKQVKVGYRTLSLLWTGTIENGMHEKIEAEFDKVKDQIKRVDLYLNSCGGSIREMKATIASLRQIKKTHRLETGVGWANECASACVPIFLQGQSRYGALTSSWLFHEAGRGELEPVGQPPDKVTVSRELTERLFNDYYLPAGVSKKWLDRLRRLIKDQDYFQTGEDLVKDESHIITHPLDNVVPRDEVEGRRIIGDF